VEGDVKMKYIFNVHEGIHEYIKLGRNYPFPPPPTKRCHNPKCNKLVSFRKHYQATAKTFLAA